jgi:septal ring factor EnvC (AmiA/AmiB activator)
VRCGCLLPHSISKLQKEKSRLAKQLADNEIEVKKLTHKQQRLQTDQKDAKARLESMLDKNEWIEAEKHLFGKVRWMLCLLRLQPVSLMVD